MQYPILAKGDRGSYVILLQKRLQDWGLNPGPADGVFGAQTEAAVRDFQCKRKAVQYANQPLTTDGVVGLETWAELTKTPAKEIEIVKVPQLLNPNQALKIFGRLPSAGQLEDLNSCLDRYRINTPPRMRHFLSQIAHESGGLRWLRELSSGWAYEFRLDLGNKFPGDGPKYKGAGAIQLTGRSNYAAFSKAIGDPKVLEIGCNYVAEHYPFTSAGFWWSNNNMNALCDNGASVEAITRRVNGGTRGLSDRVYYYNKACQVIN